MTNILALTALALTISYALVSSFHDAPNSTAIPVRHRALGPHTALTLTALFNALGVGLAALTITTLSPFKASVADPNSTLTALLCALLGTIGWNFLTWRLALPSSSTIAISSGLIGSSAALGWVGLIPTNPLGTDIIKDLLIPMAVAPIIIFGAAWALTIPVVRGLRHVEANHIRVMAHAGMVVGSTATSLTHGLIHGYRTIWLLLAIPTIGGLGIGIPLGWAATATAITMTIGSLYGAWRIAHTLSNRLVSTDALRGGVSQSISGVLLFVSALGTGAALSTSHATSAAVLGAGTNQKYRSINHRQVRKTLICWTVTPLVCAVVSGTLSLAFSPLLTNTAL